MLAEQMGRKLGSRKVKKAVIGGSGLGKMFKKSWGIIKGTIDKGRLGRTRRMRCHKELLVWHKTRVNAEAEG